MSVVLSVEDVGPWKKELKVEVPSPAVDAETNRVVNEYRSQVRLPGFRQGKVPGSVVRKRFSEDIEREVVERLVPRYWSQAESEKQLDPLLGPRVEKVEFKPGEPMVFTVTVEVRPEFELAESREFELPEIETHASEAEVDEVMQRFRHDLSNWTPVERPGAQGDRLSLKILEVKESAEGADEPEPEWQDVTVEIGDDRVWEELSVAVTGLARGQNGEFTRSHAVPHSPPSESEDSRDDPDSEAADAHDHDHDHAEGGHVHEHRYRFEVVEVMERELPELDDDLARKMGDFEDLAALRSQVEQRIGMDKTAQARRQREKSLIDQLRERNPLELPQGAVETEIEGMLRDWAQNLVAQGVDLEQAGIDWGSMRDQIRPEAESRLHARLLLDAVAQVDGIEVSESEIEAVLADIGRSQKQSAAEVRRRLVQEDRIDGLRNEMKREKALRHLLGESLDRETATGEAGGADEVVINEEE